MVQFGSPPFSSSRRVRAASSYVRAWGRALTDVPLRRIPGQQRLEALDVVVPNGLPHGAAFIEGRSVSDVGTAIE